MNFPFDAIKVTEVACLFIRREGGSMNVMKLVKLVYLLDRLSIARRGIPVVGGTYFALPNGPITSELLDVVNAGSLGGGTGCRWDEFISDRHGHLVELRAEATTDDLAPSELDLIDEVYAEHGGKDQWGLRDWTHLHCAEWTPLEQGRELITVESIAQHVGKGDEDIRYIKEDATEQFFMAATLR